MKIMTCGTALVLTALSFAGCSPKRIAGTDILDTDDTRALLAVVDSYRRAVERRDANAVLALVSPAYFDNAGTPDPTDDMDYTLLSASLPKDYEKLTGVKFDMQVKQVTVEGERATVELLYDSYFRVKTRQGEVPKQASDVQRMSFKKEHGAWKFLSGL